MHRTQEENCIKKIFAVAGVIILMVLSIGPFFDNLKFPQKTKADGTWDISSITSPGYNDSSNQSLAIDNNNHLHLSYRQNPAGPESEVLNYAYFDGSSWVVTTVDDSKDVGEYNAIAIDSNNHPHISYYDAENKHLKYAYFNGTSWTKTTVDNSIYNTGEYNAIAIDSNNHPHIIYIDNDFFDLKYAYFNGTTWEISVIDTAGATSSSIDIDSTNHPHISYYSNLNLKYAYYTGTTWVKSTVDSSNYSGSHNTIKIDSLDKIHINYWDSTNHSVKYAYYDTSWSISTIHSGTYTDPISSMDINSLNNKPSVIYYDSYYTVGGLTYSTLTDTGWISENVTDITEGNENRNLVLDSNDFAHIVFFDESDDYLKYATNQQPVITPQTASVTTPADSTYYRASNMPTSFSGKAADGTGGTGLNANSTTFYIKRNSDNNYWTGSGWTGTETWLATTHSATSDSSEVTWNSNATLPTWSSGETYTSKSKATNKSSQTLIGDAVTYYYDSQVPATASVSTPSNGNIYSSSTMPATFSGSAADGSSGFGLNANSATFYIKNSSNQYWTGSTWTGTQTWLATTHSSTTGGNSATWNDNISLPAWTDGTYYSKTKAIDKAGNTFEGSEISYIYSTSAVLTATVVTPSDNSFYRASNMPTQFQGQAADSENVGLNANSTLFYIKRGSDNHYWDGTDWDSTAIEWLATNHSETNDNTEITWTSNAAFPAWNSGETYYSAAKATNKNAISYTGGQVIYFYDSIVPQTASVTSPANSGIYGPNTMPAIFSGNVADDASGFGLNTNSSTFYLQNAGGNYWTGSTWTPVETWLSTTHLATSNGSSTIWQDNITLPTWSNGIYNAKVKATDKAGNIFEGVGINFEYTNVAPDTASVTTPTDNAYYRQATIPSSFSGNVADGAGGLGLDANSTEYYIRRYSDGKWWTGSTWSESSAVLPTTHIGTNHDSEVTWTSNATMPTWTDGETYTTAAKATNKAGSAFIGSYTTYHYDSTPPTSTPVFTQQYYSSVNWPENISGTASDTPSSGVASVETNIKRNSDNKYWDGNSWESSLTWLAATGTTSWSYNFASGNLTSDVSYTVQSKATDNAGNVQTSFGSAGFTYDNTAPSTPAVYDGSVIGVETPEVESLTTLSANWTASTDPGSGIDHYDYAIGTTQGGTDLVNWTNNSTATAVTKSGLNLVVDGIYYFSIRAINGAGTTGTAGNSSGQTVVDHTPPIVTLITFPPNPTNDKTPTFGGDATDAMTNISLIEYKVDDGSWTTIGGPYISKSESFTITIPELSDGTHNVDFRAKDSEDNVSNLVGYSFTVDTVAPSMPDIKSILEGSTINDATPTISGTGDPNTTIHLKVQSDPKYYTVIVDGSGNWSFTIPDSDALAYGEHTIEAYASDAAGNNSSTKTIKFTVSAKELAKTGPDLEITLTISIILTLIGVIVIETWYRRNRKTIAEF